MYSQMFVVHHADVTVLLIYVVSFTACVGVIETELTGINRHPICYHPFPISNAFVNIDLFALKTVIFASYERVAEIKSTISFNKSTFDI